MYCYNNPFQPSCAENVSHVSCENASKENAFPSLILFVTVLIVAIEFAMQI